MNDYHDKMFTATRGSAKMVIMAFMANSPITEITIIFIYRKFLKNDSFLEKFYSFLQDSLFYFLNYARHSLLKPSVRALFVVLQEKIERERKRERERERKWSS